MQPPLGFVLYVDNRTKAVDVPLKEAQRIAAPYTREKHPLRLRIESADALSPPRIWRYDRATGQWVESS